MDSIEREEQARQRFMLLNVTRLFGLGLVGLGVVIISGKIFADIPELAGYALLLVGIVDFFIAPVMLKRAWRSGEDGQG